MKALFEYQIIRSKRKTLQIQVLSDGQVVVRAPMLLPTQTIKAFVRKKSSWVEQKILLRKRFEVSYQTGDTIVLFGLPYQVQEGNAKIDRGVVYLPKENRDSSFCKLLCDMTAFIMERLTQECAQAYGFEYRQVKVSKARTRWGTCSSSGVLKYSFRTALLPLELCKYIVIHELCHTRHFNHGKQFWKEVEKYLPNWRVLKNQLKEKGALANVLPF